ncbi:MAG: acyltransferase family protein [Acidimicrobiales bacterium]|nr:acyltransferase family protein [Acidimicrobiales bacterium]
MRGSEAARGRNDTRGDGRRGAAPRGDDPRRAGRAGRGGRAGRPGGYDEGAPPLRRPSPDPRARRAPVDPGRAARWDDDLSDPSELSGWRQRQAEARRQAHAAGAPDAPAPERRAARRPAGPPAGRGPVPPQRGSGRRPGRPGAAALDQGWQGAPPQTRARPGGGDGLRDDGLRDDDLHHDGDADRRAERAPRRTRGKRTAPASGPRPELPYLGGFDGIRAIALLAVMAFHHGFEVARGGFLGISSFFTLSGFLVATLALAEWAQNGRLDLARVWELRARRIVPALVAVIALVVVLQTTLRVGSGPGFRGDVLAALGQVLNWHYVVGGDGFASVLTDPSSVQHLWSMSVLVQITVLFPLVFVGLMAVTGKRWRTAGAVFALAAAGSFVGAWATADRTGNDGMAYFGTHTRVGELLVGVVLAYMLLSPGVRRSVESPNGAQVVRYGAPVALVALVWLWHSTGLYSSNLFAGVTALNALLTAWLIFAVTIPGPAADLLGSLPFRTIGKVSYAAYLLHWPLFLLVDEDLVGVDGPLLFVARVGVSLAAAALLTYGLEQPFRRKLRLPRPRLAIGLVVSLALVAVAALVLPEQPPAGVTLTIGDGNGPGALDVVVPTGDEAASIALVGGSFASGLPQGIEAWNAENTSEQVRVHTHLAPDCPLSGPGPVRIAGEIIGDSTDCDGFGPRLPHLLDQADADVVVVVPGVGDLAAREIDQQWLHLGDPVYDSWLRQHLTDLADTLARADAPVLWATSLHVRVPPAGDLEGDWTDVAENDPARVDRFNDILRDVADREGFTVIDLDAWGHQLARGEFNPGVRAEGGDLTEDGAVRAAGWLVPKVFEVTGAGAEGEDEGSGGGEAETAPGG